MKKTKTAAKKTTAAKARATKAKTKAKSSPKAASKAKPKSLMLVYGFDDAHEPRAAVFQEADFKLAKKAAGLLRLHTIVDQADKLGPAIKGIKPGNVYSPRSGFAPEIGHERFEALLAALNLPNPPLPSTAPRLPVSFDDIAVGDRVLAQADSPADGWWPGVVEKVDDDVLSVRSTDFPDIVVARHRYAVALAYTPDYVAPDRSAEAAPGLPVAWDRLTANHLVIARQSRSEGSFEALVSKVEATRITMRWRDLPKLPAFTRTFAELALLYPLAPEPKPSADDEQAA